MPTQNSPKIKADKNQWSGSKGNLIMNTSSVNELYIKVLTIAANANEGLPSYIGDNKIAPDHIFSELINAGYLTGKHEKLMGGGGYFMNLEITIYGRQYLQQLISEKENKTIKSKAKTEGIKLAKWIPVAIGAILIALISAWLIKKFIG